MSTSRNFWILPRASVRMPASFEGEVRAANSESNSFIGDFAFLAIQAFELSLIPLPKV